ncbi:MAG: phosphopantetheine-binding protein [Kofleriaceae bacterium]
MTTTATTEASPDAPDVALEQLTVSGEHLERTCQVIARALARPVAEVQPTACLMRDLHVESIDLLDVVFSLEQEFGIEITRGALEAAARGSMSEDEFAPAGKMSSAGLARLRALLPEVAHRIDDGLRAREVMSLFTPTTFARIVAGSLAAQQGEP